MLFSKYTCIFVLLTAIKDTCIKLADILSPVWPIPCATSRKSKQSLNVGINSLMRYK